MFLTFTFIRTLTAGCLSLDSLELQENLIGSHDSVKPLTAVASLRTLNLRGNPLDSLAQRSALLHSLPQVRKHPRELTQLACLHQPHSPLAFHVAPFVHSRLIGCVSTG